MENEIFREVFWGIGSELKTIFYVIAVTTIVLFLLSFWRRVSIWTKGTDDPSDPIREKGFWGIIYFVIRYTFSRECLFAKRVMPLSRYRGVVFILIVWGFLTLFTGTIILSLDHYLNLNILKGSVYQIFSLLMDIAGISLLIGLTGALLRRIILKDKEVINRTEDIVFLLLLILIVIFGFIIEGIRLSVSEYGYMESAPVGYIFSQIFGAEFKDFYPLFWMIHSLLAFAFIMYLPYSKGFHIFASQITTWAAAQRR